MLRRLTLVLLCLVIPWQAWAVTFEPAPCPMAAQMAEQMAAALASGDLSGLPDDDCCNDAETFARTGQACQTGQDSHAPTPWLLPAGGHMGSAVAPQVASPASLTAPPGNHRTAIWRPPTRA